MSDHWLSLVPAALTAIVAAITGVLSLTSSIRKQFDVSRKESEARAARTHARIDDMRAHMGENFVSIGAYAADQRRIDDALQERDRQMNDLNNRLNCPAVRGPNGG